MSKRRVHVFKAMPDQSMVHLPGSLGSGYGGDKKRKGRLKKVIHKKGQE